MATRSFARQSSHPSTRRLSLSLSLSLSRLSRARLSRLAPFAQTSRARATASSPAATSRWLFTRARVRHRQSRIARASLVRSLIPHPSNRSPTSRHSHLARVPRTSRDAVRVHVPRRQRLDRLHHPLTVLIVHHPVVDPPRRRRSSARRRRRRRRDATRCVVDRTRSIDVDRCRSDSIDPIERRSMSIQTRSIGLDRTRSDSIDRTRSDSIDRTRSDAIGRDRTRSDAIDRCGGRWSSMSRDRSSARLGVCATDPRPRVPRRARAFVRQSETRETRDRATEAARKCVRS